MVSDVLFKTIIKRVIFQNFGWKIRVLSPGENGAPYTRSLHSLLLAFLLTTLTAAEILLWKVNHKCQNKNEALTVNDSFFVIWKNAASKTHSYTVLVKSENVLFMKITININQHCHLRASRKLNGAESFCGIKCYYKVRS